jgi:glycosyltransferase involved in cell wall biosynthesis
VFSVPTVYRETKGVPVIEALARGVPVVQPSHGSFPELVNATGGGLLVHPGDPRALAEAMAELLRDPQRRRQLGEAGREAVRAKFTDDGRPAT